MAQNRSGQEPQAVRRSEIPGDEFGIVGQVRCNQRRHDLDGGDRDDDEDRRPWPIPGVEHPQLQQDQRVGEQRERRERDRDTEVVGVDRAEVAVGEQRAADGGARDGHERDDGDQRHHRQSSGQGQIGEYGRNVLGGGVAAQSRHDDGQDGHPDHAERQHQNHPGVVVDGRPGRGSGARDPVADHQAHLADQYVEHHRRGHRPEPLEARVEAPERPQADPLSPDGDQQHGGLGGHPERGTDAEHQQFGVAHDNRIDRKLARHNQIGPEGRDGHHVVDHRRPGRGAKHVAVVQDCHEDRRQAVEEHLG